MKAFKWYNESSNKCILCECSAAVQCVTTAQNGNIASKIHYCQNSFNCQKALLKYDVIKTNGL